MGQAVKVLHQVDKRSGASPGLLQRERDNVLVEIALYAFRTRGRTEGPPALGAPGPGRAGEEGVDEYTDSE